MTENLNKTLALQLKKARTGKGWSLDTTSKYCAVSKAMLGQIERGESSPTVARLWKIATGFELPLSYFFSCDEHNALSDRSLRTEAGITISTLFVFDPVTKMEVFSLTLAPGHEQVSAAHNSGVIEHILVTEGEMEYFLDNKWLPLNSGEVVKFKAEQVHGYRNVSAQATVFQNIICYPSGNES
ncbi:helix-turn-helix domain-containing protein [Psychromonas ossibalaenae]|uniref:helix-turn-helix domain-containing protein n=1 Tax=Psychromonas ossibalaenae TaxID=444922 RepID=UPI000369CC7E|nr:XRE family transcriptional regulator [Psychromonas ossibalaenae]